MMMVNQVPNNNLKVDGGFVCKLIFEQLVRFDGSMSNIISTEFAHKQIESFSPLDHFECQPVMYSCCWLSS